MYFFGVSSKAKKGGIYLTLTLNNFLLPGCTFFRRPLLFLWQKRSLIYLFQGQPTNCLKMIFLAHSQNNPPLGSPPPLGRPFHLAQLTILPLPAQGMTHPFYSFQSSAHNPFYLFHFFSRPICHSPAILLRSLMNIYSKFLQYNL